MTERLIIAYVLMAMMAALVGVMGWSLWYNSTAQKLAREQAAFKRRQEALAEQRKLIEESE